LSRGRAVVIGAGAIGIASAYFLRRSEWDVTVVDRGEVGQGCSYANSCLIVASHSEPIPRPGVIRQALRWMLKNDSSFYIRPRLDVELVKWGLGFRRHCNAAAAKSGSRGSLASCSKAGKLAPSRFASLFTRRDRFDAVLLEQDLDRLRALYRNRGFAGAQLGPTSIQSDSNGQTTIVIPIFEGARYRLGETEIDADPLLSRDDVADWLPESERTPSFDASRIEALVAYLKSYYRARGYPAIKVEQRETARTSGDTIDVRLVVRQGGFYLVGHIEFRGNERQQDRELRQYVDLVEKEPFDQRCLEPGERNLMSLGHFRHVAAEVDFASRRDSPISPTT
jgi:hypothetical protein